MAKKTLSKKKNFFRAIFLPIIIYLLHIILIFGMTIYFSLEFFFYSTILLLCFSIGFLIVLIQSKFDLFDMPFDILLKKILKVILISAGILVLISIFGGPLAIIIVSKNIFNYILLALIFFIPIILIKKLYPYKKWIVILFVVVFFGILLYIDIDPCILSNVVRDPTGDQTDCYVKQASFEKNIGLCDKINIFDGGCGDRVEQKSPNAFYQCIYFVEGGNSGEYVTIDCLDIEKYKDKNIVYWAGELAGYKTEFIEKYGFDKFVSFKEVCQKIIEERIDRERENCKNEVLSRKNRVKLKTPYRFFEGQ